ncbi:TRAP transporter small permease [Leisingera sp. ANG-M1]|jgi:TRAP-type C4-dicarboxylate transport system permease small subunit|uniref:TRAP transporter small permease n=1 Tax=Leisingera sp. ANG-M1 TaxID=1577895 RepID=UPI00068B6EC1|nr:TRAP transporter small permease subunit [Leisingera sp. ANG-M1]
MPELVDKLPNAIAGPVRVALAIKNFIIVVASLIMAVTFGFVVVARYGFSADLFAYEEWLMVICFWMFFMASAMGTYDKSHVNADLLGFVIKDPRKLWLRNVIIEFIEVLVTFAIIYWAWLMIADEISYYPNWQTTIALQIPFLVPRIGIFLGFILMAVYSILHLYVLLKTGAPDTREDNQLIPRQSARGANK